MEVNGPNTFDCSGLIYWIYKTSLGISVPGSTGAYAGEAGSYEVGMDNIQPGDVLIYRNSNDTAGHAALYIGGDEYIHAPQTGDVVKIAKLSNRQNGSSPFQKAYRFWE